MYHLSQNRFFTGLKHEGYSPLLEQQMVTWAQKCIVKPNPKYALVSNCSSITEPKIFKDSLNNPLWLKAMHEELRASEKIIHASSSTNTKHECCWQQMDI